MGGDALARGGGSRAAALALGLLVAASASTAHAVPGPDSVVVLANADVPGSVALAMRYAAMRDVPAQQVCALHMPTGDDMSLDDYRTDVLEPLRACLGPDVEARIEAIVVMRGVPMRVLIPVDGGHYVATTAALGLWRSTLADDVTPVLGTPPGRALDCGGTPCYGARLASPYSTVFGEPFHAGYEVDLANVHLRPVLATMLHGRSDDDAGRLLDAAAAAEAGGEPAGEFLLMLGGDEIRAGLDDQYPDILSQLQARGVSASIVPFDSDLHGRSIAGFAVGTATLGSTIEANTYVRGALVDNFTSVGALPSNFAPTGEFQVSIARWVASGAAGVHGCVDEPLSNAFPSRRYLVSYVDGATLAESMLGAIPYAYWLNLVLGDPMLAPYAQRPRVAITGVADGDTLTSAPVVHVEATPPPGRAIAHLALFVDGIEVARADGASLDHCLALDGASDTRILAVATTAQGAAGTTSPWPAKGWAAIHVHEGAVAGSCVAPDAGVMPDAGTPSTSSSGCGCSASREGGLHGGAALVVLALLVYRRRGAGAPRRRTRKS